MSEQDDLQQGLQEMTAKVEAPETPAGPEIQWDENEQPRPHRTPDDCAATKHCFCGLEKRHLAHLGNVCEVYDHCCGCGAYRLSERPAGGIPGARYLQSRDLTGEPPMVETFEEPTVDEFPEE